MPVSTQRFAAGLEYDGSGFCGWQTQSQVRSVQQALNTAISLVANETVTTAVAGRTDTGVHAFGQVVHFDTRAERPLRSWLLGVNSHLPPDMALQWVQGVSSEFHARYSALARTYRYVILHRQVRAPLERHRAWCLRQTLAEGPMSEAGTYLLGRHDFRPFVAPAVRPAVRCVVSSA